MSGVPLIASLHVTGSGERMPRSRMQRRGLIAVPAILTAIVLIGINLRGPLVALSPVAAEVRGGLGIDAATLGLLTSLPVLCFGLAAPLALLLIRRLGADRAVLLCLAGIVAGVALRSVGPYWLALASTVLLGVAITIGNVVVPVLIRSEVPASGRSAATGAYTASLNIGTMLTTVGTVPIAVVFGWRVATASWLVLGIVAAAVWVGVLRRAPREAVTAPETAAAAAVASGEPDAAPPDRLRNLRDPLVWLLAGTFCAQAFSYYGVTTWLPTLLADERGLDPAIAGDASAIFQIAGLVGGLGVPFIARSLRPAQILLIVGLCWCVLPIGLLVAPQAYVLWSVIGGVAQGGGFAAIFTIVVVVARDAAHSTFLSAFIQGVGYVIAAAAPPLVGALHEASGDWTTPMIAVLVATALFTVLGVIAALRSSRAAPAPA